MPTQTIPDFNDNELTVLKVISEAETGRARHTQRELAGRACVSLGMANILLRRLAERGWVKLTRLSSKSVRYALTPSGIGELAQRTRRDTSTERPGAPSATAIDSRYSR